MNLFTTKTSPVQVREMERRKVDPEEEGVEEQGIGMERVRTAVDRESTLAMRGQRADLGYQAAMHNRR